MSLIGILIIIVGFMLKLDTIAVVVSAGLVTGLVSGMSITEILTTLGSSFVNNRTTCLFMLTLPVIGLCERYGLKAKDIMLIKKAKVLICGITFKPNVNDIRNSKVIDIINSLKEFGVNVIVQDNHATAEEVKAVYDIEIDNNYSDKVDVVVFAVDHEEYKNLSIDDLNKYFIKEKCIFDIKNIFDEYLLVKDQFFYWSL